jgi:hypothetical protein
VEDDGDRDEFNGQFHFFSIMLLVLSVEQLAIIIQQSKEAYFYDSEARKDPHQKSCLTIIL